MLGQVPELIAHLEGSRQDPGCGHEVPLAEHIWLTLYSHRTLLPIDVSLNLKALASERIISQK